MSFFEGDIIMRRAVAVFILLSVTLFCPVFAGANSPDVNLDFSTLFEEHGAIMLVIEPQSGSIVYANSAAASFYGYTREQLLSMNIYQINTLTPAETRQEMQAAEAEHRNYFLFKHRLAGGEVRTVEVFSYPVKYGETDALYSIVHDITAKTQLEEKEERMKNGIIISGGAGLALLFFFLVLLAKSNSKLKASRNEIDNYNTLQKTFIDALDRLVYLKDENLKYVFVNRAMELFYNKKGEEIIGKDDYMLSEEGFAQRIRQTDQAVLKQETLITEEVHRDGRVFKATKFPVKMLSGRFGVGAYITDVTEEYERKLEQQKVLQRQMTLADVLTRSFQNRQEKLDYVLHKALELTESKYGYITLYDQVKREFSINSWTRTVMKDCEIAGKLNVEQLDRAGLWGEVVRQGKPIIINDYGEPNPLKKGYPEGHVALKNFMSVPVVIDEKIAAVVALANKNGDYDVSDVYEMTLLMNGIWNSVERITAQEKLAYERNKYFQILISIGDGVMVVDRNGKVEMLNSVAEKLTGWSTSEASGRHYKEIFVLSHEQEGSTINDPIEDVFETGIIQELGNHAVLTSRDGTKYYLEDSAAPIKDEQNIIVGVVLVFRDITDKKKQREQIEYLSFHDSLTGLYNRRFFEEELRRLDTERNLPLSIIVGDVNGLKQTNDIFGHSFGDILLERVADVLRRVCRVDDIIARWGGDEFVLLLPKTNLKEAEQIIERIKSEFSKEQVKAIKGSISMGAGTKENVTVDILDVLDSTEERMYAAKTLERNEFRDSLIDSIVMSLHENSAREREHSLNVSILCQELGRALNLPEVELRKLKKAGYLHDIGKTVLAPKIINRSYQLSSEEFNEIKKHPVAGYRILSSFDATMNLAEAVLAHHEHWDGSGYPKGLKGEEIPLPARIIMIAGSYERMIYGSENTRAMSETAALSVIKEKAGTLFDPRLAELFVHMIQNTNK